MGMNSVLKQCVDVGRRETAEKVEKKPSHSLRDFSKDITQQVVSMQVNSHT